ncbi:glycosyltransferase [Paenibacillus oenotherae]|uniref:Glycosyltransferase n=1 Tax=Paenibacillus oenotherae TaxID=1435645 RepID=A0ABS7D9V7_9BACL|nr:glycosyltransferase [Paenibacillus oenotherae]MBW7476732.1 glycosyltransferase [Paenibacillus oenotherae]
MKILHVTVNLAPRYGGVVQAVLDMAGALAARGHEVTIYTTNQDGPEQLDVPLNEPVMRDGVEVRYFPIQNPRFWGTSLPLAEALKADIPKFDVVHTHGLYLFHDLCTGHYCRKHGVPYIMQPHGTLDPYMYQRHRYRKSIMETLFGNRNIKRASGLIYTTEEEKILAKPYTFGAEGYIVPNGLDMSDYETLPEKGRFRSQYPQLQDQKMVLFFSRLNFKKGLDILIRAFSIVQAQHPDSMLVITGPDNENFGARAREWIQEEGIESKVIFTGMLTGQEKLAVLRDADLFVLPSYSENFGIAVIEAMVCGTPVMISDKVNIWRELEANRAGRVAPCSPELFAEGMNELLADKELSTAMGQRGRELVQNLYQWERVGESLEKVYMAVHRDAGQSRPRLQKVVANETRRM